jgi:hypothetical protein
LVPPRTSRFGIAHNRQVKNHTIMAFMGAHDIRNWRPSTIPEFRAVRHLLKKLEVSRLTWFRIYGYVPITHQIMAWPRTTSSLSGADLRNVPNAQVATLPEGECVRKIEAVNIPSVG